MHSERMDPIKAAPFELGQGPDAVLLIHGFTGSPWDMRPLGEALAGRGYYVKGIRLPGHGLSPEAMLGVTWRDWERAVFDALGELHDRRRVFVGGLSMGALLSVILAARHPERVHALALLAPAVRFRGKTAALLRAFRRVPVLHRLQPWVEKDASDICDPEELRAAPVLRAWPSARLYDLFHLQDRAAEAMGKVRAPALVGIAEQDHVVTPEGAEELARGMVGSRAVRFLRVEHGFHIMPRDFGRQRLFDEVAEFFERYKD